ncbi:hypothetical protein IG196_04005 [Variovorax sp. 38R]|nr:hypothetical protein [Variovorax sp. 38R]QOF81786.1 hypothetical protein IG196_04005 [Variovorax sp. 38R]
MVLLLSSLGTALGALCVYRAAPRQRLGGPLRRPAWLRGAGCALMLAGVAGLCRALHPAAGFFTALTLVMCVWIALPYLTAGRPAPSEDVDGAQ